MKNALLKHLLAGGCFAAIAQTALCQGRFYTSRSAFDAVLRSSTTVTFEEVPSSTLDNLWVSSVTSAGVTVSAAYLTVADPNGYLHPVPGTGKCLCNVDGTNPVTIELPGGVTALGADFLCGRWWLPSFDGPLTVNLAGGGSQVFNFSGATDTWLFGGVTFPKPITQVIFDDGGTQWPGTHAEVLDNVTYGVAVPEVGSAKLLMVGAGLLWAAQRRHRVVCVESNEEDEVGQSVLSDGFRTRSKASGFSSFAFGRDVG